MISHSGSVTNSIISRPQQLNASTPLHPNNKFTIHSKTHIPTLQPAPSFPLPPSYHPASHTASAFEIHLLYASGYAELYLSSARPTPPRPLKTYTWTFCAATPIASDGQFEIPFSAL